MYLLSQHTERFNYKTVDWDTYNNHLEAKIIKMVTALENPIDTIKKLEQVTNQLFKAIDRTTREVAPPIKITPHTKRWWTKELTSLCISRNKPSTNHYKWRASPSTHLTQSTKPSTETLQELLNKPKPPTGRNG